MKNRTVNIVICAFLVAITLAVFLQTVHFDFINFDDSQYVYQNPYVSAGLTRAGLHWAFTDVHLSIWQPLVWISYMVDNELQGPEPGGYHLTNVLLHLLNTLLLFILLARLTGYPWRSAMVAALFAIHPIHVESVAWVAERKDVISTPFWLLCTLAYVEYSRSRKGGWFWVVFAMMVLGLMAKPMLVTLPLTLLLWDYWPLGKRELEAGSASKVWAERIRDKAPLLATAVMFSAIAVFTEHKGQSLGSLEQLPLGVRVDNALYSSIAYLIKTVWPMRLGVMYPHPGTSLPIWQVVGSAALLIAITVLAVRSARRYPYILFGWLWYLLTMLPVIQLVQVGPYGMADHYSYVPLIGIFIAAVWGAADLAMMSAERNRVVKLAALGVAGVALIGVLSILAHTQTSYWQNTRILFAHTLEITRNNAVANRIEGDALAAEGRIEEAIGLYEEAVRIDPQYADAYISLGMALHNSGKINEAIAQYALAIKAAPQSAIAHLDMGTALAQIGKTDEAIEHFEEAARLNPASSDIRFNLAAMYYERARYTEAWSEIYECRRLGGQPNPAFIEQLESKMPDPGY